MQKLPKNQTSPACLGMDPCTRKSVIRSSSSESFMCLVDEICQEPGGSTATYIQSQARDHDKQCCNSVDHVQTLLASWGRSVDDAAAEKQPPEDPITFDDISEMMASMLPWDLDGTLDNKACLDASLGDSLPVKALRNSSSLTSGFCHDDSCNAESEPSSWHSAPLGRPSDAQERAVYTMDMHLCLDLGTNSRTNLPGANGNVSMPQQFVSVSVDPHVPFGSASSLQSESNQMVVVDAGKIDSSSGDELALASLNEFFWRYVNMVQNTEYQPGEEISCMLCPNRLFSRRYDLILHIRSMHLMERRFCCGVCGGRFKRKSHLETHVRAVHEKSLSFFCDQCFKKYTSESTLKKHVKKKHSGNVSDRGTLT